MMPAEEAKRFYLRLFSELPRRGVLENCQNRIRSSANLPHDTLTVGHDRDRILLSAAFGA